MSDLKEARGLLRRTRAGATASPHGGRQDGHSGDAADRQFIAALGRGLAVLRCFSDARTDLGVAEIVRLTGMPQPTVWRLCGTLVEAGYLLRMRGGGRLRPAAPVAGLAAAALGNQPILDLLRPHLRALEARFEGAVSLAGRDGMAMIFLARHQGRAFVTDERVGTRVPLGRSSLGWAWLAAQPGDQWAALAAALAAADPDWPTLETAFTAACGHYARTGYIVTRGTLDSRINAAAVPLRLPGRDEILALSCGGLSTVFTEDRFEAVGTALVVLVRDLGLALPGPHPPSSC